ncbi:MAG: hypothetical protein BWY69_00161 [Planctomycetes bacterium ADurb.Bin401]|jgi:hypothetical protein|nr:MAG: hypothetical protein BWY69_00161 [Planctomycetes bacterium ADurb.Bin401]
MKLEIRIPKYETNTNYQNLMFKTAWAIHRMPYGKAHPTNFHCLIADYADYTDLLI